MVFPFPILNSVLSIPWELKNIWISGWFICLLSDNVHLKMTQVKSSFTYQMQSFLMSFPLINFTLIIFQAMYLDHIFSSPISSKVLPTLVYLPRFVGSVFLFLPICLFLSLSPYVCVYHIPSLTNRNTHTKKSQNQKLKDKLKNVNINIQWKNTPTHTLKKTKHGS